MRSLIIVIRKPQLIPKIVFLFLLNKFGINLKDFSYNFAVVCMEFVQCKKSLFSNYKSILYERPSALCILVQFIISFVTLFITSACHSYHTRLLDVSLHTLILNIVSVVTLKDF